MPLLPPAGGMATSVKAITFRGIESLAFEDVEDPRVEEPTDAVVRVVCAGLCGSDLHPYFGRETGLDVGTVMGHEVVGEIVETGSAVVERRAGDRVVAPFSTNCGACFFCRAGLTARCERGRLFGWVENGAGLQGCQAEYVRIPFADATLVPVPDGLESSVALLAGDILATAVYGAELANVDEGDVVAVVGCGPVGLLAVRAALARGARRVVAVDRVPTRLDTAVRFGAVAVSYESGDPRQEVEALTDGRGADAAIEAVGSPQATRMAADLLRAGGRLAAVGVHTEPHLALSPGELYDRNLTYSAGRCPAREYMPQALELAARETELFGSLISHRLPLSDAVDAYRRFGAREPGWNKVVLHPDVAARPGTSPPSASRP